MTVEQLIKELIKPKKPVEVFHSSEKKVLRTLSYQNLTVEEFRNSNIPDDNLSSAWVMGLKDKPSYNFVFASTEGGPEVNSYIKVIGETKKVSEKPERWEKNYLGLKNTVEGLQRIVKGEREEINEDPSLPDNACMIKNSEMEMTQKGIAEVARKIDKELGFVYVMVRFAHYKNVVPLDPSLYSLGFNLPTRKFLIREWK